MRRQPLFLGALAVIVLVGAVVAAGAFSVPATALSVDGLSMSRGTLNSDLSTVASNQAYACYLDADIAVRSGNSASLPSISGTGGSGSFSTAFVDFWLSEQINNLLIEKLADNQHLPLDATALSAGRADLETSISSVLAQAAAGAGQAAVCAPSGASIVASLPSGLVDRLVRAQAAGDLVLSHAAGYGLTTADLARYFEANPTSFQTICLSAIQVADQATATTVRAAIELGESFAAAAKADSTDTTSAANGGALGCFSANEGAYATVAADVGGLAVGEISQPISNNGTYLLLMVTSYVPAAFDAVVPAVRQAVLLKGASKASSELSAFTKAAQVSVDPRYGRWVGTSGVGIEPPAAPRSVDLVNPNL